jgi:hypothetical protein
MYPIGRGEWQEELSQELGSAEIRAAGSREGDGQWDHQAHFGLVQAGQASHQQRMPLQQGMPLQHPAPDPTSGHGGEYGGGTFSHPAYTSALSPPAGPSSQALHSAYRGPMPAPHGGGYGSAAPAARSSYPSAPSSALPPLAPAAAYRGGSDSRSYAPGPGPVTIHTPGPVTIHAPGPVTIHAPGPIHQVTHTTTVHTTTVTHQVFPGAPNVPGSMGAMPPPIAYHQAAYGGAGGHGFGAAAQPQPASAFAAGTQAAPRPLSDPSAAYLANLSYRELRDPSNRNRLERETPPQAITRGLNEWRQNEWRKQFAWPWAPSDDYSVTDVGAHLRPVFERVRERHPLADFDQDLPLRELIAGPPAAEPDRTAAIASWRNQIYPQDQPYRELAGSSSASGDTQSHLSGSDSSFGPIRSERQADRFAPVSTRGRPDIGASGRPDKGKGKDKAGTGAG